MKVTTTYEGYTIVCENGLYWLALQPLIKYASMAQVRIFIDKAKNKQKPHAR